MSVDFPVNVPSRLYIPCSLEGSMARWSCWILPCCLSIIGPGTYCEPSAPGLLGRLSIEFGGVGCVGRVCATHVFASDSPRAAVRPRKRYFTVKSSLSRRLTVRRTKMGVRLREYKRSDPYLPNRRTARLASQGTVIRTNFDNALRNCGGRKCHEPASRSAGDPAIG